VTLPRSFAARTPPAALAELMDDPSVDEETFRACLESLATVNRASFGYRPTRRFVARAAARHGRARPLRILDVGSGYGDGLRALARRLASRKIAAELTGADLNPHAARVATAATQPPPAPVSIRYVTRDARALGEEEAPDIILSALFCHHLEDDELTAFLRWMDKTARLGWFVNDLYRSRFAALGFGALATATLRHPFVRHDGPVSFARAFRKADWQARLAEAGIDGARIFIGAPFRLCVEKFNV
jgi:2-polyprenyl-3-methyl-5-hydroxy-6-metoxy-1,4-benzoquinol methylase